MSCTETGRGRVASAAAVVVVVVVAGLKTPWQVAQRDRECGELEVVNRLQVGGLLDGGPVVEPALHGGEAGGEITILT